MTINTLITGADRGMGYELALELGLRPIYLCWF